MEAVRELQRFRKALFVERLGWNLITRGEFEIDQFDTSHAMHCLLKRDDTLVGGFRAIPANHPYLARSVFPELATRQELPRTPDYLEISRFGVDPMMGGVEAARIAYAVMLGFGLARQATALVALVDLYHERLLRQLGVKTVRYGAPAVVGRDRGGRTLVGLVGEIPLSDQSGVGFRSLLKLADEVEIEDEALVFRRWTISA